MEKEYARKAFRLSTPNDCRWDEVDEPDVV
jgi:hypothetical protein